MLQLLQLEQQLTRREAELACVHRDHGRPTHMGADQALGRGYAVARDRDDLVRHDVRHGVLLIWLQEFDIISSIGKEPK